LFLAGGWAVPCSNAKASSSAKRSSQALEVFWTRRAIRAGRAVVEGRSKVTRLAAAGAVLAAAAGLGSGCSCRARRTGGRRGCAGRAGSARRPRMSWWTRWCLRQVRGVADRDQDLAGPLAGSQAKSSADGLDDPDVAGLGVGEQDAVDGRDVDSFGEAAGAGDHDEGGRVGVLEGRQSAGAVQGRVGAGDGDRVDSAPVGQVGSVDGLGEGSRLGDAAVEGEDSREAGGGGGSQRRDRVRCGLARGLVDEDLVVAEQLALDGLGEVEAVDDRTEQGGVGHGQRCRPVVPSGLGRGGDGVDLGGGHEHARGSGQLGAQDDPEVGAGVAGEVVCLVGDRQVELDAGGPGGRRGDSGRSGRWRRPPVAGRGGARSGRGPRRAGRS
jgi:hypothetical protein